MTTPQTLRDLAAKARHGPWRVSDGGMSFVIVHGQGQNLRPVAECWGENSENDAPYIAALSPDVLTALLDLLQEAHDALESMPLSALGHAVETRRKLRAVLSQPHSAEGGRDE